MITISEDTLLLIEIRDILTNILNAQLHETPDGVLTSSQLLSELVSQGYIDIEIIDSEGVITVEKYTVPRLLDGGIYQNVLAELHDPVTDETVLINSRVPMVDYLSRTATTLDTVLVPMLIIVIFILAVRWFYDN